MPSRTEQPGLPVGVRAIFRALVPRAERDELVADLSAEYEQRRAARGRIAAASWAWYQAACSVPALFRRGWWRGMTGFEPDANRMHPGGPVFESWIIDCRYAVRRLLSRPLYATLAVLTLALGVGGTAAIFSIARTLLLDPLPIAREDRVAVFWFPYSWSEQEFLHFRPDFPGFRRVAAYRPNDVTLELPGTPLRLVPGIAASVEFFEVLGVAPLHGRTLRPGDDSLGAEPVVVLSHSLWQELGGHATLIGRPLEVGGITRTVVGVMPRGFWYPSPTTRIWTAAQLNPQNRAGRYTLVGLVDDRLTMQALQGPLRAIADELAANFEYPAQFDLTKSPHVTPVREYLVGDVRPSVIATLAAMAAILLIACTNVAALMLGQVDARSTELAIRSALGANRGRLIQQIAIEALVIGAAAGLTGALLAGAGFSILVSALPLGALADTARLDWTLFTIAMGFSLLSAAAIGFVPGFALWRDTGLRSAMATARTGGVARRGGRLESGLVVAQMALAVLLTAGAGLLIRSVGNLRAIDPGVRVDDVVVLDATMPARLSVEERRRVLLDVLPSLQALPAVTSVAAVQKLPLRGSGDNWGIAVRGRPPVQETTAFRMVTRDYFATLGIPLKAGRTFESGDRDTTERVVVVNEALVSRYFPSEDPIGRVLQTFDDTGERIIGVVGNVAEASLTDGAVPARYMLFDQVPAIGPQVSFALRADGPAGVLPLLEAARGAVRREGVPLALQQVTTMRAIFDQAVGPTAQVVILLSVLAFLALVLGAVGVYGVISHYVTRRSREYGICIALGLPPSRVIRQVVMRGALLVTAGCVIGVAAAFGATHVLSALLYGVRASDPLSLGTAVVVLIAVGVLAAFLPARRASLTDPAVVLRQQ